MTALWTAPDAAAATAGRATTNWTASGVSIDTRTLRPGDLFVALKAARDGHDFVAQALAKGAAAALVTHIPDDVAPGAPLLIVDDVLQALEALGRAARARTNARVVAVTGSVGKTSTKEMLRCVLSAFGRTHAAEASYNNHWGVPLTLARMPADTEFAIIEIGMNHPGEIAPLSRLARPHVAMITTVAPAHLEAFENVQGIAHEKAAIFDGLEPDGAAVINADIDTADILKSCAAAKAARSISFGMAHDAHHRLFSSDLTASATVARGRAWRSPILFKISAVGRHFAMNGLGVLAVAHLLGCDRALAIAALGRWSPVSGRGERQRLWIDPTDAATTFELIDDSYNANPASLAASLDVLAAAPVEDSIGRIAAGRRIAVLGDMKELGPTGPDLHAAPATSDAMQHIDRVHCVGPLMKHLWKALPKQKRGKWHETSAELASHIRQEIDAGDVVLVKGSLSMDLARVVDAIRKMGQSAPQ